MCLDLIDIAGETGHLNLHPYSSDDEAVADFEVCLQIVSQGPAVVKDDGIGTAEVVNMKTITFEENRAVAARDVGIAQNDVAARMAADGNRLFHTDGFPLPAAVYIPF